MKAKHTRQTMTEIREQSQTTKVRISKSFRNLLESEQLSLDSLSHVLGQAVFPYAEPEMLKTLSPDIEMQVADVLLLPAVFGDMESLIQLDSRPRRKSHQHRQEEVTTRGVCRSPEAALDSALPSDSDHNLDAHSSEEELEVINCGHQKRKWRDDDADRGPPGCPPLRFRTSPPAHAHRPGRCVRHIPPHELCSVSPRKRHRRTPTSHAIQRPCLDFEKMQQINRVRLL